jgi:prevent-host-death family protein
MTMVTSVKRKAAPPPPRVRTIKASEFKAKCLALMDEVAATGEAIVITKNGKPVARLVQEGKRQMKPFLGCMEGMIEIVGDVAEGSDPIAEEFAAMKAERIAAFEERMAKFK